mgnify:CR=1 FL=1
MRLSGVQMSQKGRSMYIIRIRKELISQILTKQHGCLMNDILNHSYEAALANSTCWKRTFIDELITYYIQHPKLLRTIQKNIASILDTKEHRDMVFTHIERMPDFLKLLRREQETEKKALNRFLMMMEKQDVPVIVCFNKVDLAKEKRTEIIRESLRNCGHIVRFYQRLRKKKELTRSGN